MPEVPIVDLHIPNDDTIIPRVRVDTFLQSEYRQAFLNYGGWGDFPPVICDQDLLVLDGSTRILAAESAGLKKAKVTIVNCSTAGERLLVAAKGNATHGKRWESQDLVTLTNLAEKYSVSKEDLAGALRVSITKIERLPISTVTRAVIGGGESREHVYIKKSLRSALGGRVITEREADLIESLTTPNPADLVLEDFLRLAELGVLPPLNPGTLNMVERTREALDAWVVRDSHLLKEEAVAS